MTGKTISDWVIHLDKYPFLAKNLFSNKLTDLKRLNESGLPLLLTPSIKVKAPLLLKQDPKVKEFIDNNAPVFIRALPPKDPNLPRIPLLWNYDLENIILTLRIKAEKRGVSKKLKDYVLTIQKQTISTYAGVNILYPDHAIVEVIKESFNIMTETRLHVT